ncbi:hypothetical protein [uncultured Eubacterium sp.]|uniref:hypothetical protein n=1 Tax=uncultured Eubacterium sp. TaxID=165185 RepID=UPI0025F01304|nr:hypothetical protein [uncultured Eubacterium sp.]
MKKIKFRLTRKFSNFVFLRRKMYVYTSTEQKTKNAKRCRELDVHSTFYNSTCNN